MLLYEMEHFVLAPQFSFDSFEPFITKENMQIHFEKHHMGYWNNLKRIVESNEEIKSKITNKNLEEVIELCENGEIKNQSLLNNSLQIYNHNFFWSSLGFKVRKTPKIEKFLREIDFDNLFSKQSNMMFGSGWSWFVYHNNSFQFVNTSNAERPSCKRILCLDLWEHSYYLSYKWNRQQYITDFLNNCINYEFMEKNLEEFISN